MLHVYKLQIEVNRSIDSMASRKVHDIAHRHVYLNLLGCTHLEHKQFQLQSIGVTMQSEDIVVRQGFLKYRTKIC